MSRPFFKTEIRPYSAKQEVVTVWFLGAHSGQLFVPTGMGEVIKVLLEGGERDLITKYLREQCGGTWEGEKWADDIDQMRHIVPESSPDLAAWRDGQR